MKIPFIDLPEQYQRYKSQIDAAVLNVLQKGDFILGEEVFALEKNLAHYAGAQYAITCANGTDALMLALMAIDIKPGDEIITPSFTFIATAEAGAILGAKIVLVDIDPQSYNINSQQIADKITAKTKVIMPVSLYGQVADMDEINFIAQHYSGKLGHKITVIEDAAQSFGAEYKGIKSCNLTDIATTSFFPSKPLGCYGDGGALFTNDSALAEKLKALRAHGQVGRYNHKYVGINSRLDTLQAAILNVKLNYFDFEIKERQRLGERYSALLQNANLTLPITLPNHSHVFAQYSIRVKDRESVSAKLTAAGIPTTIHYPKPIHAQICFQDLEYQDEDFPISTQIATEIISLPMSAFLAEADQDYICNTLLEVLR